MARQRRIDFPDFTHLNGDLSRLFDKLPTLIGNTALNFYDDSFQRGGYIGTRFERWQPRKENKGKPRRLLIQSGKMRRSIRLRVRRNQITIFSDDPKLPVHNEGRRVQGIANVREHRRRTRRGVTTVRAHRRRVNFKMPKRQMMDIPGQPMSPFLRKRLITLTARAIGQAVGKNIRP